MWGPFATDGSTCQEICCPVEMLCQPTIHTSSRIYCCNGTLSHHECHILRAHARCRPQYYECSANLGGGCCPNSMTCFKDQCVPKLEQLSSINRSAPSSTGTLPGAPTPREGEIARGTRLESSMWWGPGHPYSALGFLGCVAVVMSML